MVEKVNLIFKLKKGVAGLYHVDNGLEECDENSEIRATLSIDRSITKRDVETVIAESLCDYIVNLQDLESYTIVK